MSLPAFSSFDNNAIWSYSSVQFVRSFPFTIPLSCSLYTTL